MIAKYSKYLNKMHGGNDIAVDVVIVYNKVKYDKQTYVLDKELMNVKKNVVIQDEIFYIELLKSFAMLHIVDEYAIIKNMTDEEILDDFKFKATTTKDGKKEILKLTIKKKKEYNVTINYFDTIANATTSSSYTIKDYYISYDNFDTKNILTQDMRFYLKNTIINNNDNENSIIINMDNNIVIDGLRDIQLLNLFEYVFNNGTCHDLIIPDIDIFIKKYLNEEIFNNIFLNINIILSLTDKFYIFTSSDLLTECDIFHLCDTINRQIQPLNKIIEQHKTTRKNLIEKKKFDEQLLNKYPYIKWHGVFHCQNLPESEWDIKNLFNYKNMVLTEEMIDNIKIYTRNFVEIRKIIQNDANLRYDTTCKATHCAYYIFKLHAQIIKYLRHDENNAKNQKILNALIINEDALIIV